MSERTVKVGSLSPGVNNRLEPTDLATVLPDRTRGTYLSAGENIDIDSKGHLKRRAGYAIDMAGSLSHSLWGDGGSDGYVVDGANLVMLSAGATLTATVVRGGMQPVLTAFARTPQGTVIWSNGFEAGVIAAGVSHPLSTPTPSPAPTLGLTTGTLPKGRYQFAFTRLSAYDESGSTVPVQIDVPSNGGVVINGLAGDTLVYMTGPDGALFNQVYTTGTVNGLTNDGAQLRTLLLEPMPVGQVLAIYNGTLLSASGNMLSISEPYRYGLRNPSRGFIPFPSAISLVIPCDGGVYVCADQTYWLAGGLLDTKIAESVRMPFGGLRGSAVYDPNNKLAYWLSSQGLMSGTSTGKVTQMASDALKFGASSAGATLFREFDGMSHVVTSRLDAGSALTAAQSYLDAETQRKHTIL